MTNRNLVSICSWLRVACRQAKLSADERRFIRQIGRSSRVHLPLPVSSSLLSRLLQVGYTADNKKILP